MAWYRNLISGPGAAEMEKMRVGDRVFVGGKVRRGVIQTAVGVGEFVIDIHRQSIQCKGDSEIKKGQGGVGDDPSDGRGEVLTKPGIASHLSPKLGMEECLVQVIGAATNHGRITLAVS